MQHKYLSTIIFLWLFLWTCIAFAAPPSQKPTIWACDPGTVAYNCARLGLPMSFIFWPTWEGSGNKSYDYSGNRLHNTLTACTWDQGIKFNGNSSYSSPGTIDFSDTDKITFAFTLTLNALTGTDIVFELSENYNNYTDSFVVYLESDGKLNVGFEGNVDYSIWQSNTLIVGQKYRIVFILDRSQSSGHEAKIYVDGKLSGAAIHSSDNSGNFGNRILYIGARAGQSSFAPITLDNIVIWKAALNLLQIATDNSNPYSTLEPIRWPLWNYSGAPPPSTFPQMIMVQ